MPDENAPCAFVLISFESQFEDIYKQLIAEPLQAQGYVVERADSRLDQENILRKIVRGIANADLIIADLTGLNANVFYELGIAHALGVPTILLTQDLTTLPFDLRSYSANEYSVSFSEAPQIAQTIGDIAAAHLKGEVVFGSPVTDFLPTDIRERLVMVPRKIVRAVDAVARPAEDVDGAPEELGFVDLELQAVEAGDQFATAMNTMNEATEWVGGKIEAHSKELEALALNQGTQSLRQANMLAIRIAQDLNEFADVIQAQMPEVEAGASKLMDAINRRIALLQEIEGAADEDQLIAFREMLTELRATTEESVESVRTFRDSVRSVRGFSRHVNSASARVAGGLDALIAVSANLEAQSSRAIAVIGDLLVELQGDTATS